MSELRHGVGDANRDQGAIERNLSRGRRQQVLAAQDVGDPHECVIDRIDERVERIAIRADDHEVRHAARGERDRAPDDVVPAEVLVGHAQA